jgi:hypothetical protein
VDFPLTSRLHGDIALGVEDLDRDRSTQDCVGAAEHGRGAAVAEDPLEPIPLTQNRPDTENGKAPTASGSVRSVGTDRSRRRSPRSA